MDTETTMIEATGRFETEHGRKYLAQLCKHFAHKIDVTHTETHGECRFAWGTALLDADELGLAVRLDVADERDLPDAKSVIENHLARFAFREADRAIQWSA